ncbi:hypothetical protein IWX90DRAFT_487141 [Phyllosticta citrichinensis]|uniref:Uncharacterized protein n=1 Tax=Phyllosticta citrichinensis TaxID=1130410 RepID=A0ABR1XQA3_9PEZI
MNTTTAAAAAILPLSTRVLASLHVLAAATAAVGGVGGGGGGSLPTNALLPLLGQHHAAAAAFDTCYPANPTISTSSHVASHHHQQHQYQYNQYTYHGSTSSDSNADWLFSINLLYLIAAPLLLRELPAMMATLDPLIDYLFEPSSWLAFPGWCAELWRLFREEKGRIVSRRNSAEALHRASLEAVADVPRRSRTW